MIQLAVAMGDIVMPRDHSDITFRTSLVKWMDRFPAARDFITQMKFKPPPRYTDGIFVSLGNQEFTGSLVGQMLPQVPVRYLNGTDIKLDEILGPGFALIVQDEGVLEFLNQIKHELWPQLDCKVVAIGERLIDAPDDVIRLQPKSDITVKQLRSHRDQIILIRPDRYVAATFDQYNFKKVIPMFSRLLR
jgi:3-(3-hydroxy-phenyl)propionate hydroxylase